MRSACLRAILIAGLLSGCGGTSGPPTVSPAMIAASRGHADLQVLAAGRKVFVNRCIECHVLPAINEHSASAWPPIIAKMSARADLTPNERDALVSYILAARAEHP